MLCSSFWYTSILILFVLLLTVVSFDSLLYSLYFVQMAITLPPHVLLITSPFCSTEWIPCCLVCLFGSFPLFLSSLRSSSHSSFWSVCHLSYQSAIQLFCLFFWFPQTVSQGLSFSWRLPWEASFLSSLSEDATKNYSPFYSCCSMKKEEKHANHSKEERSKKKIEFVIRYKNKEWEAVFCLWPSLGKKKKYLRWRRKCKKHKRTFFDQVIKEKEVSGNVLIQKLQVFGCFLSPSLIFHVLPLLLVIFSDSHLIHSPILLLFHGVLHLITDCLFFWLLLFLWFTASWLSHVLSFSLFSASDDLVLRLKTFTQQKGCQKSRCSSLPLGNTVSLYASRTSWVTAEDAIEIDSQLKYSLPRERDKTWDDIFYNSNQDLFMNGRKGTFSQHNSWWCSMKLKLNQREEMGWDIRDWGWDYKQEAKDIRNFSQYWNQFLKQNKDRKEQREDLVRGKKEM